MIKTFLFDLGNVLVRFSHQRMHDQIGALIGLDAKEVERILARDRLQWRYEAGDVTTESLIACFARFAKDPIDKGAFLEAASDIFDPIDAMQGLTRHLKSEGYRLILVSNTNEAHVDFLRRGTSVFAPFDELVLSYKVNAMKPATAFYEAALQAAQCARQEALFIDDLAENVAGADRFGFETFHFTGHTEFVLNLERRGLLSATAPR